MAEHKRRIAGILGCVAALHQEAKGLEAEGVEEMDMTCCQLEDLFATLEPLLGEISESQSMAENC